MPRRLESEHRHPSTRLLEADKLIQRRFDHPPQNTHASGTARYPMEMLLRLL